MFSLLEGKRHIKPSSFCRTSAIVAPIVAVCLQVAGCAASDRGASPPAPAIKWSIAANQSDAAVIDFQFPAPQDAHGGQVRKAEGWIVLDGNRQDPCGFFAVNIADVDMGDADLTRNVQYARELLHAEAHPRATYTVKSIVNGDRIAHAMLGAGCVPGPGAWPSVEARLLGDFELKGVSVPLEVAAEIECVQEAGGEPHLLMTAEFALDSLNRTFGITGPGGADAAGDRLLFNCRFVFTPVGGELLTAKKP